jgi:methyl-accepting chemotaxis protein
MVAGHISVKKKAMACVAEFAKGNFDAPLERFPGKKAFINDNLEQLRENLQVVHRRNEPHVGRTHQGRYRCTDPRRQVHRRFPHHGARGQRHGGRAHRGQEKAMACVAEFGRGNFDAPLERFPGKKAFINDTIEQVRVHLKNLIGDTDTLISSAADGKLDFAPMPRGTSAISAKSCRESTALWTPSSNR